MTHGGLTECSGSDRVATHDRNRKGREVEGKWKNRREPVIHRHGPDARGSAPIAATGSHSPAPTMDERFALIGGGR